MLSNITLILFSLLVISFWCTCRCFYVYIFAIVDNFSFSYIVFVLWMFLKFDTYLNIMLCTHIYCNEIFTGLFIDKCTKATTHVYKPLVVVKWKTSFLDFTSRIWWLVFGRHGYRLGVKVSYIIYRVNFAKWYVRVWYMRLSYMIYDIWAHI